MDYVRDGSRALAGLLVIGLSTGPLLGCTDDGSGDGDGSDGADATAAGDHDDDDDDDDVPTGDDDDDDDDVPTGGDDDDDDAQPWVPSLEVDESVGTFLSVWGASVDALYAVGGQTTPEETLTAGALYRYDGREWTPEDLPTQTATLNWVYGVGDRRVVVGDFGTVLWRDGDSGSWNTGSCQTVLPLWGVWGATPDELWAVGGDGFNKDPVMCRFDGTAWTPYTLPLPTTESHALFKVWGTGADHIFAVGDNGWIVQYNGSEWFEVESGTESDLISLWGRGPDEILAVGGRTTGALARWNGDAWSSVNLDGVPGLNGIWMDAAGNAVVGGTFGTIGRVAAGTMELAPDDAGTLLALHAVFGLTDSIDTGPLFAVGGSLDMSPPYVGVILTWPGGSSTGPSVSPTRR